MLLIQKYFANDFTTEMHCLLFLYRNGLLLDLLKKYTVQSFNIEMNCKLFYHRNALPFIQM